MRKIFLLCAVFLSLLMNVDVKAKDESSLDIIPKPSSLKRLSGAFKLDYKTKIIAANDETRKIAGLLNDYLLKTYGFKLEVVSDEKKKKNAILLSLSSEGLPEEGYRLTVGKNTVAIAGGEAGMFYAFQTFTQLLPIDKKAPFKIPCVEIVDQPRFGYRGMHLDVGRHFFSVEFVKKYLDLMAQYKFNRFHWHLTEDQGWRIEIKKYPKLTEIGSKRKETVKGRQLRPYVGDGIPYGGYYTQEQIKDVVAYAQARHITIIPEIEMPGHSSAAIAAYPELACTDGPFEVVTSWGIFKDIYCPKEETFKFLEDVLSEVIELFPGPYIHIGGDEAPKDRWKESPIAQEIIKREGLKDEHELQSHFIRRIEKFLNSKSKRLIGWDEILEGGLAPNATVMSWRGEKGGIEAAKQKHDVVMTPTTYVYFDYSQGNPKNEPLNIGSFIPLGKVYGYDPVPKELAQDEQKYILGAQGNVWTEYMKTPENVEYMAFPRMIALAEVNWARAEIKNYDDFLNRLSTHLARLETQGVNFRIPEPLGWRETIVTEDEELQVVLTTLVPKSEIYYTLDGSAPTVQSKRYEKNLKIKLQPEEKVTLNFIVVTQKGRESVVYSTTLSRGAPKEPVKK
jgi:hexosaminidase